VYFVCEDRRRGKKILKKLKKLWKIIGMRKVK
jgi:16S rRNA C1402 (ribose-2'-O) methylase RsmI